MIIKCIPLPLLPLNDEFFKGDDEKQRSNRYTWTGMPLYFNSDDVLAWSDEFEENSNILVIWFKNGDMIRVKGTAEEYLNAIMSTYLFCYELGNSKWEKA